jgi:hypothetical protein
VCRTRCVGQRASARRRDPPAGSDTQRQSEASMLYADLFESDAIAMFAYDLDAKTW